MAGNVKLLTSAGGGVVLDTATTTATDVIVKVPVTGVDGGTLVCSNSSGNVGIGTSSPSKKLDVYVSGADSIVRTQTGSASGLAQIEFRNTQAGCQIGMPANVNAMNFITADTERMRIDSSGNVGIGTTGPSTLLHLASATDPTITIQDTNESTLKLTAGGNANIESSAALIVRTGGSTERMRIDSSGNLLVGTTNTSLWTASSNTTADNGFAYSNGYVVGSQYNGNAALFNRTGSDGAIVSFYRSGTTKGNISITTSAVAYNTTSDYRLKENIQPMQNALAVVQQLNPVTYQWKADGSDGQGFIAHELQAVVPDCVTGEKDAVDEEGKPVYQGIDTSFLVATLTKAIQELSAKNDALEARIAALEAK